MTHRERERQTLDFCAMKSGGSAEETFYPWDETVNNFIQQGLPTRAYAGITYLHGKAMPINEKTFFHTKWAEGVMAFEDYFGFDPILRVGLALPVRCGLEQGIGKLFVASDEDWEKALAYSQTIEQAYFTPWQIEDAYAPFRQRHQNGDYAVRVNVEGFFFATRELLGIEEHLYAFYDNPHLLHKINDYILTFYSKYLTALLRILPADVLYLSEDLSGKNGPMVSPALFEEFVGDYYRKLFPILREAGTNYIFVDTDGEFNRLIPHFIDAGVDGFLPMDVNAGMDIQLVRDHYPQLRMIGGYNKLVIAQGKEAIDAEFARILPVIKQGGYLPGCDHQLPPDASLENYCYYSKRLRECMQYAGINCAK